MWRVAGWGVDHVSRFFNFFFKEIRLTIPNDLSFSISVPAFQMSRNNGLILVKGVGSLQLRN